MASAPASYQLGLGPVSRKPRELFGPEKPLLKLRPAYSVKLIFSYVVKGVKVKIIAKFRASRRLRFEDTKRIMSPEIRPKSFGTFEKQAPGFDSQTRRHMWIKGLISWRISSWAEVSARLLVDYIERDTPQDAIQPGLKILARYFQTGLGFLARPNGLKNPCNRYHFFQPGSKKEREHAHRLCFCTSVNFLKEICVLSPG